MIPWKSASTALFARYLRHSSVAVRLALGGPTRTLKPLKLRRRCHWALLRVNESGTGLELCHRGVGLPALASAVVRRARHEAQGGVEQVLAQWPPLGLGGSCCRFGGGLLEVLTRQWARPKPTRQRARPSSRLGPPPGRRHERAGTLRQLGFDEARGESRHEPELIGLSGPDFLLSRLKASDSGLHQLLR